MNHRELRAWQRDLARSERRMFMDRARARRSRRLLWCVTAAAGVALGIVWLIARGVA
ncbi:MAG: hypothetical protein ACK52I_02160 [Pseudomonadota bacterium]|jgi:cell division septal protein FtsQ